MREEVVEAQEEDHQGWTEDHKHVHGVVRQQSCKRKDVWKLFIGESAHLGAVSWLSNARRPSFLQHIRPARLRRPLVASVGLSSDETVKQCFACTKGCHAPKSLILSLVLFVFWGWGHWFILGRWCFQRAASFWSTNCGTFGQPDVTIHPSFLMPLLKVLNVVEYLHQGWRVQAFMFYGFPRGPIQSDRTTQGEKQKTCLHSFPATQRLDWPQLSHSGPPTSPYSLLLGPTTHRFLYQQQDKQITH